MATLFDTVQTKLGRYWFSKRAGREELRRLCRGLDTNQFRLLKQADLGGEPSEGFEQAFSSLAYSYIKEKAPRLLDFLIGFQLVDRNEDKTKALGVFGFKVGESWYYVPVFFLSGSLKGHELLYVKDQDMFVPLKENWVNDLISRKPHTVGKSQRQTAQQAGSRMPLMSRYAIPGGIKYSMDRAFEGFIPPLLELFGSKSETVKQAKDLSDRISDLESLKFLHENFYHLPAVKAAFDKHYGPDWWVKQADRILAAQRDILDTPEPGLFDKVASYKAPSHPCKNGQLRHITADMIFHKRADCTLAFDDDLDATQKKKLLTDGELFLDKRPAGSVSIAYRKEVSVNFSNPHEHGIFDVLVHPDKTVESVVLLHPISGRGSYDAALVLEKSTPAAWTFGSGRAVYLVNPPGDAKEKFDTWFKGKESAKLKKGQDYVAVMADGTCTAPFEVMESSEEDEGSYRVYWYPTNHGRSTLSELSGRNDDSLSDRLVINKRKGTKLHRASQGGVYVPEEAKFIRLSEESEPVDPKTDDIFAPCCGSSTKRKPQMPLGTVTELTMVMMSKTAELNLFDNGSYVHVTSKKLGSAPIRKQAALAHLILKHGLAEDQARSMLKEAEEAGKLKQNVSYRVKYAAPFEEQSYAEAQPEPEYFDEPAGAGSTRATTSMEYRIPINGLQAANKYVYNDPYYRPDERMLAQVQESAASGSKEIFDTTAWTSLLRSQRRGKNSEQDLGDLFQAMDNIGRRLFEFFWDSESFAERYGSQDMPELEDTLRNCFESMGDLILFLKEKSVNGGAMFGRNWDASGPDITQAARM